MAINLRRERTLAAARRLSEITGEPMVTEIERALLERLDRLEVDRRARKQRIAKLSALITADWPEEMKSGDPTRHLYDEAGLPR